MSLAFDHVVLRTRNLEAMGAWYQAVLGARVVARGAGALFLSYDGGHHRLALVDDGPLAEARALAHVAFAHPSLAALLGAWSELAAAGIEPIRAVDHRVTASLYYRDPDGNWLELCADLGGALDPGAGATWRPARLAAALAAGAGEDELRARLWDGR